MYDIRLFAASAARLTLAYVFWNDRPGYLAAGIEHNFYDVLALRMGYNGFSDLSNGLNFGLGFDLSRYTGGKISVDYSYGATYSFGDIHKFGSWHEGMGKFLPPLWGKVGWGNGEG